MRLSKKTELYCLAGFFLLLLTSATLFFVSIRKPLEQKQTNVLSLFLPDSSRLKTFQNNLSPSDKGFPAKRQYLSLHFNGDPQKDKINLESSRLLVQRILTTNDTLNGINFHFTDKASYASFVNIIDLLKTAGAKRYLFMNNDIWFYHFSSDNHLVSAKL